MGSVLVRMLVLGLAAISLSGAREEWKLVRRETEPPGRLGHEREGAALSAPQRFPGPTESQSDLSF